MPAECEKVKELTGKLFSKVEDSCKDAAIAAKDIQVWAIEAKKLLEKAKDDDLEKVIAKALEPVANGKDNLLRAAKGIEKSIADIKKAASSAK